MVALLSGVEEARPPTDFERIWHTRDSQGQILALALRQVSAQHFELFPFRSKTARDDDICAHPLEARNGRIFTCGL